MYQIGDQITIEPAELVAGGAALARVDGFPIFAAGIYPGDVARVRVVEVKKGFARAELVEIVSASPLRRAQPCPVAGECGGCDWTALRLDAQLKAKERILRESLRRIGKFQAIPEIALHPAPLNYRLRSRLHGDGDAVGFFAMRSNRVVPLARECEVVGVETARHPIPGSSWEIDGRIITDGEMTIHGYAVSTEAFFQVNRHLLDTMLRLVEQRAAPHPQPLSPLTRGEGSLCTAGASSEGRVRGLAIDLYAGVGFFSVPLSKIFEKVIAVEGSRVSYEYAKRNVPANVELIHAPVESYNIPKADMIFLDPPRAGARRNVIDAIAIQARARICFLACDPVTFSRDAARLTALGWRLATLDLLDLFPNTHHVETLASFERAS